jgi:hypothetical protein
MPRAIRKFDDANLSGVGGGLRAQMSVDSFGTAPQLKAHHSLTQGMEGGLHGAVGGPHTSSIDTGGKGTVDFNEEQSIQQMIAEREAHFFKEIAKNPQLKNQHPLMHLINAQEKLKMIDEQSGVLVSKTTASKEGLYSAKYGKQTGDKFDRYHVYEVDQPYRMEGKLIAPAKWHKMKRDEKIERAMKKKAREERKKRRQEAMTAQMEKEKEDKEFLDSQNPDANEQSMFTDDSALVGNTSSKKHSMFLRDTMAEIQSEVDKSIPLLETMQFSFKEEEKKPSMSRKPTKVKVSQDDVPPVVEEKINIAAASFSAKPFTTKPEMGATNEKEEKNNGAKDDKEKAIVKKGGVVAGKPEKAEKAGKAGTATAAATTTAATTASRPGTVSRSGTAQGTSRPGTTSKSSRGGSRPSIDKPTSAGSPKQSNSSGSRVKQQIDGIMAADSEVALLRQWGIHPSSVDDDDVSLGLGFHDEMGSSSLDEAADVLRSLMSAGNDGVDDGIIAYTPTPSIMTLDYDPTAGGGGGIGKQESHSHADFILYTPAPSLIGSDHDGNALSIDNSDALSVNSLTSQGSDRASSRADSRARARSITNEALLDSKKILG